MATLIFQAVGTAIGGPLGGIIGTLIGGFIDSQFLFPAIFGRDSAMHGPRLDDLRIQTASEGSSMMFILGSESRVAGVLIWRLKELIEKQFVVDGGKGGGGGDQVQYKYFIDLAIGICDTLHTGPISAVKKVWADSKVIFDSSLTEPEDARYETITFYSGQGELYPDDTGAQGPDPTIVAEEDPTGLGIVPHFTNTALMVVKRFALKDWGNRIPNFSFLVEAKPPPVTVASALESIYTRSGLTTAEIDTADVLLLDQPNLTGYAISGPHVVARQLEPLMLANDLTVKQAGGKMVFRRRDELTSSKSIAEADLAAHVEGDGMPPALEISDESSHNLPSEVNVSFIEKKLDYQKAAQRERLINWNKHVVKTFDIPFVITAEEARQIARRRLWGPWAERQSVEFSLPPSFLQLKESDKITVTFNGNTYAIRILEMVRGRNFQMQVRGVIDEALDLKFSGPAEDPSDPDQGGPYDPPPLTSIVLDFAALRDADVTVPGIYFGVCATDTSRQWAGCSIFFSDTDVPGTFEILFNIGPEGFICQAETVLADAPTSYWDRENTVDVIFLQGQIAARTEAEVLNGANRLFLGGELIGFQNVTALTDGANGEKRYTIDKFLRGLRNTETKTSTHATNEFGVFMSPSNLFFQEHSLALVGETRFFKAVATGEDEANVTSVSELLDGGTLIPFSPTHLKGRRNNPLTDDWTITWIRRTRSLIKMFNPAPLNEDVEEYEVDVMDNGDVINTYVIEGEAIFVYTAAEQILDFGSTQASVHVKIYQISSSIDRGRVLDGTVS